MKIWLIAGLLAIQPGAGREGSGREGSGLVEPATVKFGMERPASLASYRFTLREDGTGVYKATYPPLPPATPAETAEVPLMLHAALTKKIFEQAGSTVPLHGNCESKAKNIALTGIKTLTYTDAAGAASNCTWNYSEKQAVVALQEEFVAMASTLDLGRRLKMEQRYNRLELDKDIAFLMEQVKNGQARGVENIAPVLEAIALDETLLERVRARARTLLQMSVAER